MVANLHLNNYDTNLLLFPPFRTSCVFLPKGRAGPDERISDQRSGWRGKPAHPWTGARASHCSNSNRIAADDGDGTRQDNHEINTFLPNRPNQPLRIAVLPRRPRYLRANWFSNRIFQTYDAIIDAACEAWRKLTVQPEAIKSIGMREWVNVSQPA
jgi:hypothetical protein